MDPNEIHKFKDREKKINGEDYHWIHEQPKKLFLQFSLHTHPQSCNPPQRSYLRSKQTKEFRDSGARIRENTKMEEEGRNAPNSNLVDWTLEREMELPEIFQGLVFDSSAERGLALTVT